MATQFHGAGRPPGFSFPDHIQLLPETTQQQAKQAFTNPGTRVESVESDSFLTALTRVTNPSEGFIKHFLGLGDTPTVDAVELNTWMTGQGAITGLQTKAADAVREFASKSDSPALARAMVDRITMRFNQLRNQIRLPSQYRDKAVYQHLMHHWLWDRAKGRAGNNRTTRQSGPCGDRSEHGDHSSSTPYSLTPGTVLRQQRGYLWPKP